MTRAYLRIDPELVDRLERKGYPDGAIVTYLAVLCAAETQTPRGRFRNARVLRGFLNPRHLRNLAFLFRRGDLVETSNSCVEIPGWDEWQEGNIEVAERMRRVRDRRKRSEIVTANTVTSEVTNDVTPDVTVPSEPLAVSRKRLATPPQPPSGETEGQETEETDAETMVKAQAIAEWFTSMTGPLHLTGRTLAREAAIAQGLARLPMDVVPMIALMRKLYVAAPDDNKPNSLNYFAAAMETAANEALKVLPTARGFGNVGGSFTRIGEIVG